MALGYKDRISVFGLDREGREASGGGIDRKEAVVEPTGTYSGHLPPDATRAGTPKFEGL